MQTGWLAGWQAGVLTVLHSRHLLSVTGDTSRVYLLLAIDKHVGVHSRGVRLSHAYRLGVALDTAACGDDLAVAGVAKERSDRNRSRKKIS